MGRFEIVDESDGVTHPAALDRRDELLLAPLTLAYTGHDWADPALARRSMELMANEVLPRMNRAAN